MKKDTNTTIEVASKLHDLYGFEEIVSFLSDYSGAHYSDPEKSGDLKEFMAEMKRRGQDARRKLISFCQDIASQLSDIEYVSCSNWVNQGQTVERYLWAELKNEKWKNYPQSLSLSVEKHNDQQYPGEGFYLSVRAEVKDAKCKDEDYRRQFRLLDCDLLPGMTYRASLKAGDNTHFFSNEKEHVKQLCSDGSIKKLEIIEAVENLPEKDASGDLMAEVMNAVREIKPLYEHVMKAEDWWPSLSEYDPGLTARQYHDLLLDENVVRRTWLEALYEMYQMPDHLGTCKQLGDRYGRAPSAFNRYLTTAASNIAKETNCALSLRNEKDAKYWPVLFYGRRTTDKNQGGYCWKMREPVVEAIEIMVTEGVFEEKDNKEMVQFDKNLILYGPPGTGKTYKTATYSVAICDNKPLDSLKDYTAVMERYNELKSEGRVAFTTFHQSYGYEEFIEGIKPILGEENADIGYCIEPGVFKRFCANARKKKGLSKDLPDVSGARVWCILLDGTGVSELKTQCFEDNTIRIGWKNWPDEITSTTEGPNDKVRRILLNFQDEMEIGDIVVVERSNRTIDGIAIITGEYEYDKTEKWPRKREVEWLMTGSEIDITELNGGKNLDRNSVYPLNRVSAEAILSLVDTEGEVHVEEERPFVFIIDEINRGNISKIFGELITLIEDTKRESMPEGASAKLPYSGESFSVPKNVYIIGTMNTADRSIALMDTALRRRFQFVEMMPDLEALDEMGVSTIIIDGNELNVAKMLDTMNARIEYLFDREHTIGHAFFRRLMDDPSIETLAEIFEKSIIPLLQEYFYEDYEKIQLVLGDNGKEDEFKFVLDQPLKVKDVFVGNPDIDLPEKMYKIQHEAFRKLDSYKLIGKNL